MGRGGNSQDAARNQESDHEKGIPPIAALFKDCLQDFERLCAATVESQQIDGLSLCSMVDGYLSKFRTWGSDTGALDGSLDRALRKSSRLQKTTKDLLGDLLSTLRTCKTWYSRNVAKLFQSSICIVHLGSQLFMAIISLIVFLYCNLTAILNIYA